MRIRLLGKITIIILWGATLGVALCWALWKNPPFDPEPITVVLGLISTAVTALLSEFDSRLREEEFSLPYALAYGYVNNFIEPLITQLLRDIPVGGSPPRLYIYLPDTLSELEPRNVDATIGKMRARNFEDKVVNLQFREGRARDVLSITTEPGSVVYFDFPSTLLSLNSLVDFKLDSRQNQFGDAEREAMGRKYIKGFEDVLLKMIDRRRLTEYVFFIDKDLDFGLRNTKIM